LVANGIAIFVDTKLLKWCAFVESFVQFYFTVTDERLGGKAYVPTVSGDAHNGGILH
jgi:hypothetical protein